MEYCFSISAYTYAARVDYTDTFHSHVFSITRTCDGVSLTKHCDNHKEEKMYQILYKLALQNKLKKFYKTEINRYHYEESKNYCGFVKADIDLINFLDN